MIQLTLDQNKTRIDKEEFIDFLENLGLDINTHTKARGHQGVFLKNRIDVSKKLNNERKIEVLAHEFAHYIHLKLEPDMMKTQGKLSVLFQTSDTAVIEKELYNLTLVVDKNASLTALKAQKQDVIKHMDVQKKIIQAKYPNFSISEKFKDFERYIKGSKAKYFLKYDRIKFITPFLRREEIYSIENIEVDFADMPEVFVAYIRLISLKRRRARISRRLNRYNKYYRQPSELFARFVESFFVDESLAKRYAPVTSDIFFRLLDMNYYFELKELFVRMGFTSEKIFK